MKSIANKNILKVKPYVPGRPIAEVQRELGLKNVIKLASNENPYGPPARVLLAIRKAAKDLNRYPDGSCYYLRRELAKRLNVRPDQLVFGNGSDEVIVFAVRALVSAGDEVIVARPSFLIYEIASRLAGAQIKTVPLKDFYYDLAAMKKAVTKKTKIIFIGNPDNPAGTYVTARQVKDFLRGLPSRVLVFFDEAYFEYVDAADYPDTIRLLKARGNILVTRTFSKMYGLAGLRLGYGIADASLIDLLERVREPFNVNSLAQAAALACLKEKSHYRRLANVFQQQRAYLYRNFGRLGLDFKRSVTNFILIDVKKDSSKFSGRLLKKGVIVRDLKFWGLKTFIRVSIGTPKENKKLITTLEDIL